MECSSPLSSVGTSTPPLSPRFALFSTDSPCRSPSPSGSMTSAGSSKTASRRARSQSDDSDDSQRPAKKRRTGTPKERTTEYLDLMKPEEEMTEDEQAQLDRLKSELRKKKKIVVIAGAGISVSAGIPDFRSSNGLFASVKKQHNVKSSGKHLFDASVYKHDSSTQSFHSMVREMVAMSKNAAPTAFHHMLASLAKEGRLLRLYSQNIDCIDTNMEPLATDLPLKLKAPWPKTIQLHGGLQKMVCTKCGELSELKAEIFDGPEAPLCGACKANDEVRTAYAGKRSHGIGRLRPRFVLYNEFNPDEEAIGNVSSADLRARPDAVIVVGTTLKVPGTRRLVKELCQVTRGRRDGFSVWINPSPEPKDIYLKDCWDLVVRAKCDTVAHHAALSPWDCEVGTDYMVPDGLDIKANKITVTLPSKSMSTTPEQEEVNEQLKTEEQQAMPTPIASPKLATAKPAKQTTLGFANKPADKASTKTAAKPRGRKPKMPAAAKGSAAPKANSMHFKAVKNLADRTAGAKVTMQKANVAAGNLPISVSLPNLGPTLVDGNAIKRPSTPDKINNTKRDTISPPSVPNSLRNIIDV